jgi:hypothetical protein
MPGIKPGMTADYVESAIERRVADPLANSPYELIWRRSYNRSLCRYEFISKV